MEKPKGWMGSKLSCALVGGIWMLVAGCSDESPASPASPACTRGVTQACLCPGGGKGVQSCLSDGSGFTPCECSGGPGGSGGGGQGGSGAGKGGGTSSGNAGSGAGGSGGASGSAGSAGGGASCSSDAECGQELACVAKECVAPDSSPSPLCGDGGCGADAFGTRLAKYRDVWAYSNGNTSSCHSCADGANLDLQELGPLGCGCRCDCKAYGKAAQTDYGLAFQCVELARRFYGVVVGNDGFAHSSGHAKDYASSKKLAAYGMAWLENGGTTPPQPDDILVFTGGDYGHIAVISEVGKDYLRILQQNTKEAVSKLDMAVSPDGKVTVSWPGSSLKVAGWGRDPEHDWKACSASLPCPDGYACSQGQCTDANCKGPTTGSVSLSNGQSVSALPFFVEGNVEDADGMKKVSVVVDDLPACKFTKLLVGSPTSAAFQIQVDLGSCGIKSGQHTLGIWVEDDCAGASSASLATKVNVTVTSACPAPCPSCQTCDASGTCVPDAGQNGASCGTCKQCSAGACGTAPDLTACGAGMVCKSGACQTAEQCSAGVCCTGGKYDPAGTPCGSCMACNGAGNCTQAQNGTSCAGGSCKNGACCACQSGTCCSDGCHPDPSGTSAGACQQCDGQGGTTPVANGTPCGSGLTCQGGSCTPTAPAYQSGTPCPGGTSAATFTCGGGIIMSLCASVDASGNVTLQAAKTDNSTFGPRPYQARVFGPSDAADQQCKFFSAIKSESPQGVGTKTLTFGPFAGGFQPGESKAYCVTAASDLAAPPYNTETNDAWFCSGKVVVTRTK